MKYNWSKRPSSWSWKIWNC